MTLTLALVPELEERLKQEAHGQGLSIDEFVLQVLEREVGHGDGRLGVADLLQSWTEEDDNGEQKETGEYLIRALDEDRLSDRKLFPAELKGITW